MLKIGKVVSNIYEYTENSDQLTNEFIIYECISDDNLRIRIVMEVWELKPGDYPVDQNLEVNPTLLSDGVCHTFQWRLEELFDRRESDDDWELIDTVEASDPMDLIETFPNLGFDEMIDAVSSWLATDYAAMNPEVQ